MRVRQPLSLKARAIQWLAQREHSRAELKRKLLALALAESAGESSDPGTTPSDGAETAAARVDALLDWLEAHNHLSEERFAESRVHARASRYGNLRIRHELSQHGLALSDDATQALRASELVRAREVWSRRFGTGATDAAGRAKQARFLTGRGFSADVVRQVLRDAGRPSQDGVQD
jgi:regulatory protein